MKKIFTIITLSVLVWGCAKKIAAPAGSGIGSGGSSNGAISVTPPVPAGTPSDKSAAATPGTKEIPAGTVPATPAGSRSLPVDPAKASPEIQGQSTYNAKCGRCHGLKVTTDYTSDRWVSIMQVMASKANLTDVEKENVLTYVRANAKK
jgi:mono/diheme cytochrome c family protein